MNKEQLVKMAIEGRKNAYTPYSHFKVGAAIELKNGKYIFIRQKIRGAGKSYDNDRDGILRLSAHTRLRLQKRLLRRMCYHLPYQGTGRASRMSCLSDRGRGGNVRSYAAVLPS